MTLKKAKSKKTNYATLLYNDRFNTDKKVKKKITRNSVLEYSGLNSLREKFAVENKIISNTKEEVQADATIEKYAELLNSLDYSLSIPPRVPHFGIEKEEYKKIEMHAFNYWKFMNKDKIFERNIEIWRQFWLVCEKADTICQILDARNVEKFYNEDIKKVYKNKKHVLLCNKSDLVQSIDNKFNKDIHYYSTKLGNFSYELKGCVCFIGYPNVGKSSTINNIVNCKKVRVSSTPGKTRYLQTIEGENFTLLDCPGLVFPKHSKIELILMGVVNIDQCLDLSEYEDDIMRFIGEDRIYAYYKFNKRPGVNVLDAMALHFKSTKTRCFKKLVKEYMETNLM